MSDEHHRRDRHVEQLLGDVLDLEHAAPAEGERGGERRSARGGRGVEESALRTAASLGGRRGRRGVSASVLMLPAPARRASSSSLVLGRVAGQGQEHLVEARLAEREVGDPRRRRASARRPPRRRGRRRRRPRTAPRDRARGGRARARRASTRSASGRCSGSSSRTCSAPEPDRRLELAGRALGDHAAVVDDGDPLGELVGLVEVLRAEQDRRPLADERADDVPDLVARARVEPGGRLVEEHQLRRDDDARGDVEPPAHAAGVVLDQPAGGLGEAERLEQLGGALLRRGAPEAEQPAEQDQVLARR